MLVKGKTKIIKRVNIVHKMFGRYINVRIDTV